MIKVTIAYKVSSEDRYGSEQPYLVNTNDHLTATITAVETHSKTYAPETITRISTNVETDVLEPTTSKPC